MKLNFEIRSRWFARSTVFAAFFSVTSFLLAKTGHLTGEYVAMCTAVQAMIVGRAIAEDHFGSKTSKPEDGQDKG